MAAGDSLRIGQRCSYTMQEHNRMEKAYKLFKKMKITLMPIVDDNFFLIDVINMDDIYKYMEAKCNI